MTTRESFLVVPDQVVAAPGPGQYDLNILSERVKGGSTLANKGNRFNDAATEVPGPGSYNVSRNREWIKDKHHMPSGLQTTFLSSVSRMN